MNRFLRVRLTAATAAAALCLGGCHKEDAASKEAQEAPPKQGVVVSSNNGDTVQVEGPERFKLVTVKTRAVAGTLDVTGNVNPDPSRELPVLSMANGRVVALHVGLGDMVHKGQLVMEVQSPDVATAFQTYLKAVNDEHLTDVTLTRDMLLYDKGAIAQSQLQGAENGEADAKADLTAALSQLRVLGVDKNHPGDTVKVYAPATGVVISQSTTAAGAAGITFTGSSGSLTIADLSHVWVVCDVYENDLAQVKVGDHATVRLNAFPGKTFSGRVSDIGAVLDPGLRTAKVRIQVENPQGMLRIGMFATASLDVAQAVSEAVVPESALLHLHDRDFVFAPQGGGRFLRVPVRSGMTLPGGWVVVQSGLAAGQQIVGNALDLQNTADQQ